MNCLCMVQKESISVPQNEERATPSTHSRNGAERERTFGNPPTLVPSP